MKSSQRHHIEHIRSEIDKKFATLVLGAGISIPFKMPDWTGLVSRMLGYTYQLKDGNSARLERLVHSMIVGDLKMPSEVNVLEAGQYIYDAVKASFDPDIADKMMVGIMSLIIEHSTTPEQWQGKFPFKNYKTIARKQSLCAVAYLLRAKNGFRRAITYNYDTLLQEYLISLFNVPQDKILTHADAWSQYRFKCTKDPIEIFHVHGCVPREDKVGLQPAFPEESERLVLSEDSYYDTERYQAYNWQNSIQSYYLNRDTCIFVGFSAEDYNFRRILRQLGDDKRSRPKHYIIFTIDNIVKQIWENNCRCRNNESVDIDELREDTIELLHKQLESKEIYWLEKGFQPIWVTIKDIPDTLLRMI